jgi:cyclopropane fatty-acyl-phospholipid synthase-like methyltransferase
LKARSTLNGLSQAAENNKDHILEKLREFFNKEGLVLEVGSGTGQHAIHLATNLPHLTWQPTDRGDYLSMLKENLAQSLPVNLCQPLCLDVEDATWCCTEADYIFSANTLHIMSAAHVAQFMRGAGASLKPHGKLAVYGPFKYDGEFTTESNADFDVWLKGRDSRSGIRDAETIRKLASDNDLEFLRDFPMPANNQLLVFQKN